MPHIQTDPKIRRHMQIVDQVIDRFKARQERQDAASQDQVPKGSANDARNRMIARLRGDTADSQTSTDKSKPAYREDAPTSGGLAKSARQKMIERMSA